MWLLQDSDGKVIYLKSGKEIIVGRKRCDIILDNDESISRVHASLMVKPKETVMVNEPTSQCIIKERGSKYGTYVINENDKIKLTTENYLLKNHDKIKFGLQKYLFTVKYIPMITVISSLNNNHKEKLNRIIDEVDGLISTNWMDTCTCLTVSEGVLTQKVVWALASAVPIVTIEYWEAVKQAINNNDTLPELTKFSPQLRELLNRTKLSFLPNEKRRSLFADIIFVHFTATQFKNYQKVIKLAGGRSVLYKTNQLSIASLCAGNVRVLQYPMSDVTQSTLPIVPEYNEICSALEKKKLRMIPENEIALAILHSSVNEFCNPRFYFSNLLRNKDQSELPKSSTLVIDTQDLLASRENSGHRSKRTIESTYIPETNDEFSQLREEKIRTNISQKHLVNMQVHCFPNTENSSLSKETLQAASNSSHAISQESELDIFQRSKKIIPETLDFSEECTKKVKETIVNDNSNIVRNIFSQSSIAKNSSQSKVLKLPESLNEGRSAHIRGVVTATCDNSYEVQKECLIINETDELSEEENRHVRDSANVKMTSYSSEKIKKDKGVVLDLLNSETSVGPSCREDTKRKLVKVNNDRKRKPEIIMISDDEESTPILVPEREVLKNSKASVKRRKKHCDTHALIHKPAMTEAPLRETSCNPCKMFKKTHVSIPERRIAFKELIFYDGCKDASKCFT